MHKAVYHLAVIVLKVPRCTRKMSRLLFEKHFDRFGLMGKFFVDSLNLKQTFQSNDPIALTFAARLH